MNRVTSDLKAVHVEAVVAAGNIFATSFRNGKDRYSITLAVPKNGHTSWHTTDFGQVILDFAEEYEVDIHDPQTMFPVRDGDFINERYGFNPRNENSFVINCSSLAAPTVFRHNRLFSVDSMPHGVPLEAYLQLTTDDLRSRIYARLTAVNYI